VLENFPASRLAILEANGVEDLGEPGERQLFTVFAGCAINTARLVVRVLDIPRSGKRGNMVWQSNRYGQYCYPAFIPYNPRTPAQVAVRGTFGAVSARWRTLAEEQRVLWGAVGKTQKSKPRLGQCGPLTGFLYFVKINAALANRGLAQVDLPPEYSQAARRLVSSFFYTGKFDQTPVGPTLFLRGNKLIAGWDNVLQQLLASALPPGG
jgi:hypothetical protein